MQLLKACAEVPVVSNEELLMIENEFLREELELKEIENNLEIYECIIDCIEKTGGVDKSLEVMFGENVSSSENFEAEIRAQYESALEVLDSYGEWKKFKAYKENVDAFIAKLKTIKPTDYEKLDYPVKLNISNRLKVLAIVARKMPVFAVISSKADIDEYETKVNDCIREAVDQLKEAGFPNDIPSPEHIKNAIEEFTNVVGEIRTQLLDDISGYRRLEGINGITKADIDHVCALTIRGYRIALRCMSETIRKFMALLNK